MNKYRLVITVEKRSGADRNQTTCTYVTRRRYKMVQYKGWRFVNIGQGNIWRCASPRKNFNFLIKLNGVKEIIEHVDLWMEVIEHDAY